jgi:hypothetical protein
MLKATTLALARLHVEGCTELTAHPRPRMTRLATAKPKGTRRIPECSTTMNPYVIANVTKPIAEREMQRIAKKN